MPIVFLSSWGVNKRVKEFLIAFLILETLMIGVFVSLDLFLFYVFFEAGLIPMFLIIGIWGGKDRVFASFKFFLYTLLGSILMLIAMIFMWDVSGTTDITKLLNFNFDYKPMYFLGIYMPVGIQTLLWLAFLLHLQLNCLCFLCILGCLTRMFKLQRRVSGLSSNTIKNGRLWFS